MACVILPSETARLVYGYLVSENLNDIALEFLERSPYLIDCRQIVKSGYQFSTKLMDKDLQDLLQEYSVIHNLANKKVNLLCKTSLLYKRIKLKCESLPEILELILFWKYRQSQGVEQPGPSEKSEKSEKHLSSSFCGTNSDTRTGSDSYTSRVSGLNLNTSSGNNSFFCANTETNSTQGSNVDMRGPEILITKSANEANVKGKDPLTDKLDDGGDPQDNAHKINSQKSSTSHCAELEVNNECQKQVNGGTDNISSNIHEAVTSNNGNCNISMNADESGMPELCLSASVLTIDMNPEEKNAESGLVTNERNDLDNCNNVYDSQIKIVRIEKETENENQIVNTYSAQGNQNERNITLEDGSVVFVSPEVGNVTIDQERNQIIVIPIDYYKSQNEVQNKIEDNSNQTKNEFYRPKELVETQTKNNLIYENVVQTTENQVTQFCSEEMNKNSSVDANILTESDFIRNKHLMFDIEKTLTGRTKPQSKPLEEPCKVTAEITPVQTVATPLIVLSQAILPAPQPPRYRSILPKKEENPVPSVVIVQPLLDSTQRGSRQKPALVQKSKNKEARPPKTLQETFNMPTIKTPLPDKVGHGPHPEENKTVCVSETVDCPATDNMPAQIPAANEEKENLGKAETKKTETPVFVTRRNSKRLSLSTPRRRSHIRALEFETPPKRKEEKKSRTSPKARIEKVTTMERKSIRNTLFKSPIPEVSFKSPEAVDGTNKDTSKHDSSQDMGVEPLKESTIPIATRSPNTKLSDAWETLTGVGCVIGQTQNTSPIASKKMWDADLRCFLGGNSLDTAVTEKKRIRKPEKLHKDNRKNVRKKPVVAKKLKSTPTMVSPSKMSLTSKRNTYSINGNEEGSPPRSLLDDLKLVTPFKDIDPIRPTEETPLTKLLRENINTIDIDLSMINTPSFPPTPSILITPDLDDVSLIGTNYYSPSKDFTKDKVLKISDYVRLEGEKPGEKTDTKEAHEKVIGDLVSKAREIIGLGKDSQEDCPLKRRPSGKILSMVKIQMLTQCDTKLCENIPINEEGAFPEGSIDHSNSACCTLAQDPTKSDIKGELEEKRKRALKKIKVVKENLAHSKSRVVTRSRKRKRSGFSSSSSSGKKSVRTRSDTLNETGHDKQTNWSDESDRKEVQVFHSTPYDPKKQGKFEKPDSEKKENDKTLSEIRQELPPYQDNGDVYPELSEKSRKKIHYVTHFLKLEDISSFLSEYNETNPPKLYLKPSFRRFFQVFYKWLKHPHKHELNASAEAKLFLQNCLVAFDKINIGVNQRRKKSRKSDSTDGGNKSKEKPGNSSAEKGSLSDEEEKEWKNRGGTERKKDEETEDGLVSILPLKKRKQTVQQVETKAVGESGGKTNSKNCSAENVSQTQNFLQDIDVDRFLSQIHGQSNR